MIAQAVFDSVSLAASATKTLVQLVPATQRPIKLREIAVTFDGSAAQKGFIVELLIQSTAGTASALTTTKATRNDSQTIQTTAQHIFTVEPTAGEVLRRWILSPQAGLVYTLADPDGLIIAAGERVALRVIVPAAATTVNGLGYIEFEE